MSDDGAAEQETERADAAELQVLALSTQAERLTESLAQVGSALANEQTWRRRFFAAFIAYVVVSLASFIVLGLLVLGNRDVSRQAIENKVAINRLADELDENNRCLVQDTINDLINQDPDAAEGGVQPIDITPGFDCNKDGRIDN